jgi:transforming growth factor-beta-induced protein
LSNDIIKAANGDNLRVQVRQNGRVIINRGSDVTTFDIMASNGVVHLIDEVLIPPKNLVDTILSDHRFSTLAVAVKAAGLVDTLKDASKEFTIFAPTNAAFKALGAHTVNALLKDPATLKSILLYHAVEGSVLRNDLRKIGSSGSVKTVQGSKLQFRFHGDNLFVNDSKVTEANILASNGVIHAIDKVLTIPK